MAISGDLRVSATLGSHPAHLVSFGPHLFLLGYNFFDSFSIGVSLLYNHRFNIKSIPSNCCISLNCLDLNSIIQVDFVHFLGTASSSRGDFNNHILHCKPKRSSSSLFKEYQLSHNSLSQEAENFLLNVVKMNFFERLGLAWKIIFPTPKTVRNSNAKIAKQRLKMILFSDRCAVSEEAKQKIVSNIVNALSDFVEIESEEKVQLAVSTDADLGTIYSVTVPVRRVKPEYQLDDESGSITNIEYRDDGKGGSDTVDVTFDFYLPTDQFN
ncbi:LOW QUALITY PROTEIN: cell division topological specificity factor homolog, chloroplastic-like [Impatiens glandulifera]|uniref:LOW QUALITY PROTEIN: cell division topological specificity factor homolog, chloroplastic-like n=1 Tax=Impatiens glandulifera TaxID=253017 RepID=UPI001FB14FE5|nr:LOW QUALITY PROTEIN: cell division topological specificity factor homolog, chloroplastic-like [Impatiens glandulifera]